MDSLADLKALVLSVEEDFAKAKAGNKAAGRRVRKVMLEVKAKAHALRQEMLGKKES